MTAPSERHTGTPMHIVCAADQNYIAHTATMLHSLWTAHPGVSIHVHFMHAPELPMALRQRLDGMVRKLGMTLHWVVVEDQLMAGLSGQGYIPPVVWYRIFMPRLLPDLDRVIYLDSDVLVVDSLLPLWQLDLADNYFAAVTNAVPDYFAHRAEELGLPGPGSYFNAGVAVWNLAALRGTAFIDEVLDCWHQHRDELRWLEQDILNRLYHQRRLPLHPRWNCQNGIYYGSWGVQLFAPNEVSEALETPAIIHFEGGVWAKPWHLLSPHPLRGLYWKHRRQTPWPKCLPEGITAINLVKKVLPMSWQQWIRRRLKR